MHMALPAHVPCSKFFAGVHQTRRLTPIMSLNSSTALDTASMDHPTEIITCYHTWIMQWHNHMKEVPTAIQVPPQASIIHTPLIIHRWQEALVKHPHQPLVGIFLIGISNVLGLDSITLLTNWNPHTGTSLVHFSTHKLWKNTWPQKIFITVILALSKKSFYHQSK